MNDTQRDSKALIHEEFQQKLQEIFAGKADEISQLLMECEDGEFFGSVQFQLRELLMQVGREVNDQALCERKKRTATRDQ